MSHKEQAVELLRHYFHTAGVRMAGDDMRAEMEDIVEHIVAASVEAVLALKREYGQ